MSLAVVFVVLLAAILIYANRLPGPVDIRELCYRSPTEGDQSTFIKTSADWPLDEMEDADR